MRLTRRALELLAEGKSDAEVQRALFREGATGERAASLVDDVRRVQRMVRGPAIVFLVGLAMSGAATSPGVAQQPADSARASVGDTTRRTPGDTARRASSDTTSRAPADSAARPATDTTGSRPAPPPVQVVATPPDSTLANACQGIRSGGVAANLLMVTFRLDAAKEDLATVTKAIGGTLLGMVPSGDGAYYVRVPAEGDQHRLDAAADQVIRYPSVQQVSPAVCPKIALPQQAGQPARPQ